MSKLETNTIDTISGTSNLTIGSTNSSTVTFESGAATGHMYPAFEAYLSASQTGLTDGANVKLQADTEVFDTGNFYDNSTNYRFTPTVAGKYLVYANTMQEAATAGLLIWNTTMIYKNGSAYRSIRNRPDNANNSGELSVYVDAVIELNGSTDYVEIYGSGNTTSGNWEFQELNKTNYFGAYRIGA